MLHFQGEWRFDSPRAIPGGVVHAFQEFIGKIVGQGDRHLLLEHFKRFFARAAGDPYYPSSSGSWAETDLARTMGQASENAPVFIEAFYDACEALREKRPEIGLPGVTRINRALQEHSAGYVIVPPNLVSTLNHVAIAAPARAMSLSEEAQEVIQASWQESDKLLSEGKNRPAVQEGLWLLETVTTAFKGITTDEGTVQGKYFNKIIADLRSKGRGKSLEQILGWMMTLHGYLSAPGGGGIRHGMDLKQGVAVDANEARLYCNLIRCYLTYLITEHERLMKTQ